MLQIAMRPAVELSYLRKEEQADLFAIMDEMDCTPSHAQSIRLKKLAQEGLLDDQMIYTVLAETKPNQQEQLKFKREELRKYFPSGYTEEQMRRDIIKGLELLKRQRERNRDAR
jgi:ParB family chromosome partitioning protein